jgi:hypothetical protein
VKTRSVLWGQSFRFAAGLLPGAGMVQASCAGGNDFNGRDTEKTLIET